MATLPGGPRAACLHAVVSLHVPLLRLQEVLSQLQGRQPQRLSHDALAEELQGLVSLVAHLAFTHPLPFRAYVFLLKTSTDADSDGEGLGGEESLWLQCLSTMLTANVWRHLNFHSRTCVVAAARLTLQLLRGPGLAAVAEIAETRERRSSADRAWDLRCQGPRIPAVVCCGRAATLIFFSRLSETAPPSPPQRPRVGSWRSDFGGLWTKRLFGWRPLSEQFSRDALGEIEACAVDRRLLRAIVSTFS